MLISRLLLATALVAVTATAVQAQDCIRRDPATGTILGAAGGAAIGGAVGGDARGAIAGAVVGGLAGNAISRGVDCERGQYRGSSRPQGSVYFGADFDQDQYWTVDSYADFENDYRRIWRAIERGRDTGTLSRFEARRYSDRLQRIQYRADRQQRSGRFDARDIQLQLQELRYEIRAARRENRDEGYAAYDGRR